MSDISSEIRVCVLVIDAFSILVYTGLLPNVSQRCACVGPWLWILMEINLLCVYDTCQLRIQPHNWDAYLKGYHNTINFSWVSSLSHHLIDWCQRTYGHTWWMRNQPFNKRAAVCTHKTKSVNMSCDRLTQHFILLKHVLQTVFSEYCWYEGSVRITFYLLIPK